MQHAREEQVDQAGDAVAEDDGGRHRVGSVGRCLGRLGARADVHGDDRAGLLAGLEERVPVAGVDARQVEVGRELAEGDGAHAAGRVATHVLGRELGIPERDQRQRQQPAAARAAPLVDHPVVVGLDAGQPEVAILGPEEQLAAEPGQVREAELGLDPVEVHVGQAGRRLPATGAHVVVGHGLELDLVRRVAGRGDRALHRDQLVLEAPPGDVGPLGAGLLDVGRAAELRGARRMVLDPRAALLEAGRKARRPGVRRFDDVRIEVDEPWDPGHDLVGHRGSVQDVGHAFPLSLSGRSAASSAETLHQIYDLRSSAPGDGFEL